MFNTALHLVLLFGCANINVSKKRLLELDKQLAKLLKSAIGLQTWFKNNNLMHSFGTKFICTAVFTSQLFTLKSVIHGTSQARVFYCFLLSKHHLFDMHKHNNLTSRVTVTLTVVTYRFSAICSMIIMCFSVMGLQTFFFFLYVKILLLKINKKQKITHKKLVIMTLEAIP